MKYLFADFKWEINEKFDFLSKEAKDYLGFFEVADFSLSVDKKDLDYERSVSEIVCDDSYLEYIAVLRKMGEILPLYDAFVLHSATFDVDGTGIAFSAPSGTGKTTHLNRWKSYLGNKLKIVNGDKPIVRFIDNKPIAYGTPWCGKEKMGSNTKTELKHICFIERNEDNFVESLTKEKAVERILNQVYMPINNPLATLKTMELIDKLLSSCSLWIIHCNKDENAGEIAYKGIIKDCR